MSSFFDPSPDQPPSPEPPEPRREPWRGTSTDTLGVALPLVELLARNDDVAVLVSGFVAYPAGFSLNVVRVHRLSGEGIRHRIGAGPSSPDHNDGLRFGLRFSDGSKVTDQDGFRRVPDGNGRSLQGRGGGGGGRKYMSGYWCAPLPPPGLMTLVCDWAKYGITQAEADVDADLVIAAAKRATAIWADDVGLPEPPSGWPRPGTGWSGYPRR